MIGRGGNQVEIPADFNANSKADRRPGRLWGGA